MTKAFYNEFFTDYLENLQTDELINLWNQKSEEQSDYEDKIYYNDEFFFDDYFFTNASEAVRAVWYGNYNYMDLYVKFNAYGNLESTSNLMDFIDLEDLKDFLVENEILREAEEREGSEYVLF